MGTEDDEGLAVARRAGVWQARQLAAVGLTGAGLCRARREGRLVPLRRGWYREPTADELVVRAVQLGGVLGCASALRWHGVWVPPHADLHVRASRNSCLPPRQGVRVCPPAGATRPIPRVAVDDPGVALRSAWACLDQEGTLAVVESLVNLRLMSLADVRDALGTSARVRALLARVDRAESGTETMVRHRLRRRGIRVRAQVPIAGVGRVDLLVGERLVIEVDSWEHHTRGDQYAEDRRRDLELKRAGYLVIRLTYHQVVHQWPQVEATILACIRRGEHMWRGHW